jgi:hypothetical protein
MPNAAFFHLLRNESHRSTAARVSKPNQSDETTKCDFIMAKDTGEDYRKGAVKERTQVENPRDEQWTKRDQTPDSEKRGEFMEKKKESGEPFKGVAKEGDERRKSS